MAPSLRTIINRLAPRSGTAKRTRLPMTNLKKPSPDPAAARDPWRSSCWYQTFAPSGQSFASPAAHF